jgi:hypothetical protein
MTPHVSDLAIARLIEGELTGLEATGVREHARSCARCEAMYRHALSVQAEFGSLVPSLATTRRSRRVVVGGGIALAAAAAVFGVVALWPGRAVTTTRTKGHPVLGFFVERDGVVRRGGTGEHVRPGDRIEMFTTAHEPAWFAVTSIDGAGLHSTYITPRAIAAGVEQVVPQSITLDDTLGVEVIEGVFCDAEFEVSTPPGDCIRDRFTIYKDSP